MAMPHVTVTGGLKDNPVYQVGGKSFVFFEEPSTRRSPITRTAASTTATYRVLGTLGRAEKQALVQDESTPFFSTSHFDGHLSVLVRARRLGKLSLAELQEIVQDAWLARA